MILLLNYSDTSSVLNADTCAFLNIALSLMFFQYHIAIGRYWCLSKFILICTSCECLVVAKLQMFISSPSLIHSTLQNFETRQTFKCSLAAQQSMPSQRGILCLTCFLTSDIYNKTELIVCLLQKEHHAVNMTKSSIRQAGHCKNHLPSTVCEDSLKQGVQVLTRHLNTHN